MTEVRARPRPATAAVVVATVNALAILTVGGLVGAVALLPIAMAADSCGMSEADPVLCTGLPQILSVGLIGVGVLGGAVAAAFGARERGGRAAVFALGGWAVLVLGFTAAFLALWGGAHLVI